MKQKNKRELDYEKRGGKSLKHVQEPSGVSLALNVQPQILREARDEDEQEDLCECLEEEQIDHI
nr:unnamed protein product [Callosobruchus chinensis]